MPKELIARQKIGFKISSHQKKFTFRLKTRGLTDYAGARSAAHHRLIFEEFFWVSFALQLKRGERVKESKGAIIEINETVRERLKAVLPFTLTGAQHRVIERIYADMISNSPMNRLVQGDVGSEKTIIALLAMLAAMENGYQTALMAPTEILAEQHARNFKRLLSETGFRTEVLIGGLKISEKRKVQQLIAKGEIHAVIGTHAIIQDAVEFEKLGLVVVDEQHRFGVMQRAELRARGFNPDVLVMTATPISAKSGHDSLWRFGCFNNRRASAGSNTN